MVESILLWNEFQLVLYDSASDISSCWVVTFSYNNNFHRILIFLSHFIDNERIYIYYNLEPNVENGKERLKKKTNKKLKDRSKQGGVRPDVIEQVLVTS